MYNESVSRKKDQRTGNLTLLILSVLEETPLHGYGIARAIEARSADALKFGEGAIYPCLRKLEEDKLTAFTWDTSGPGPAKKIYELTTAGRAALAQSRAEWTEYVQMVNRVIQPAR
jgi:DNA-binding PadR family transcriptional regulator